MTSPEIPAPNLDTTLLRAFSALLVANSHLEAFYSPTWLAGDGLLGNSLFFLMAGYGLARSGAANRPVFSSWFLRRLIRLYPAMWLVIISALILGADGSPHVTALTFFWPTPFTFVEFVVPLY